MQQHVNCAICGTNHASWLFRPHQACGPVVQCLTCGLVYINPRQCVSWPEQALAPAPDPSREWRRPCFRRYLAEAAWKHGNFRCTVSRMIELGIGGTLSVPRVLDLGCSVGLFLQVAAETGWEAHGVEPDAVAARYGQERLGLSVYNGFLADADFPVDHFDAAVSFQVFEHLPDPVSELREIWRVLRPGGLIALDVPSIDNVWYCLLRGRHRHFATPQHLYFYTPATMGKMLQKVGFRVVAIDFPSRSLSLEHLCNHHVRLCSARLSDLLLGLVSKLGQLHRTVSVNLHDVICVYARKPC
jgi:SAM-dependent methyltransferase